MLKKNFKTIVQHKIIVGVVILLAVGGGYFEYKSLNSGTVQTRYVLAQAEKGTIIISVSGTGQVSASNQVDIKPKVSGDIVYLGMKNGQEVRAGTVLAQIDATDAQKTMRDAETNLESANLALEKLKKPADALSLIQSENAIADAKDIREKADDDIKKAYDDGFNTVATVFLDLPSIMTGTNNMLFNSDYGLNQWNINFYADAVKSYDDKVFQYRNDAYNNYQAAKIAYDKNFDDYKAATRYQDSFRLEALIDETYDTTKAIAEAVKDMNDLIQFYEDKLTEQNAKPDSRADTAISTLSAYTGKVSTHLLNLLSVKNAIQNDRNAITNAERAIAEKSESLVKLKAGADPLDIRSQELVIKQRENVLLDAKEKLADYFIRSPFDSIVAKVNFKQGDSVSSGAALATLIAKQRIAEISLNEVDIAKVKLGQKATLAFDAVPDLSISGEVAEIDSIGAVSQGVVSYAVKITFDTQDERVKPAMSVSAAIITAVKQDVLTVPSEAIKSQNLTNYAETLDSSVIASQPNPANSAGVALKTLPKSQVVEIGLASDSNTEITNGLKQGDWVVVRTISPASASASSSSSQQRSGGLGIPGLGGGMRMEGGR